MEHKAHRVALRKESVDRNIAPSSAYKHYEEVALRKESVDRNKYDNHRRKRCRMSLSARRAWIEMVLGFSLS